MADLMKRRMVSLRWSHVIWFSLLAMALSACSGPAERIWLNAPGWNRARLVANTALVDPVSMVLDDAGNIYLLLFGELEGTYQPRVITLNRQAEVVSDRTYEIAVNRPDQSRILWDGQNFQLFWLSDRGLYNAKLEGATKDMAELSMLLSGDVRVASYDIAQDTGGATTVWYAGAQEDPGLYALPSDDPSGEATLADPLGILPSLQYDYTGTLHASWSRYPPGQESPEFLYAAYEDGLYAPGQESVVLEPRVGTTRVYGPWLGLDPQNVYLLWTIIPRIGPTAGVAATYYTHFPYGQSGAASPVRRLSIPYTYKLAYQAPPEGSLDAGPRVMPGSEAYDGNSYISELAVDPALAPELATAFHTNLAYLRRKEQGQVSVLFFRDGATSGYQQVSFTPASSGFPAIQSDKAGQLYLTWLESGAESGYDVYFSSTAPDIRDALARITWGDVGELGAETVFGLLGGAVLVPLALAWIVVPLAVIGLTSAIRRKDDSFTSPGVVISLALAIAAYWVGKLVLMPTIRDYVPFSAWLPFIPPAFNLLMQVGVPLLIAALALVVAWRYTYGSDRPSPFFFLLLYATVDAILTMAVYGVTFYGAF
jgi:hypothetical protein